MHKEDHKVGKSEEVPHTLPGETPEQRFVRESRETPVVLTEGEKRAQEAEVTRLELELEKAKAAVANRDTHTFESGPASVAHALSIANAAPKTDPTVSKVVSK